MRHLGMTAAQHRERYLAAEGELPSPVEAEERAQQYTTANGADAYDRLIRDVRTTARASLHHHALPTKQQKAESTARFAATAAVLKVRADQLARAHFQAAFDTDIPMKARDHFRAALAYGIRVSEGRRGGGRQAVPIYDAIPRTSLRPGYQTRTLTNRERAGNPTYIHEAVPAVRGADRCVATFAAYVEAEALHTAQLALGPYGAAPVSGAEARALAQLRSTALECVDMRLPYRPHPGAPLLEMDGARRRRRR